MQERWEFVFKLWINIYSYASWPGRNITMYPSYTLFIMEYCQWVFGQEHVGFQAAIRHFLVCVIPLFTSSCISTTWWQQWDPNTKSTFGGNAIWPIYRWFSLSPFSFTAVSYWLEMIVTIQLLLDISLLHMLFFSSSYLHSSTLENTWIEENQNKKARYVLGKSNYKV